MIAGLIHYVIRKIRPYILKDFWSLLIVHLYLPTTSPPGDVDRGTQAAALVTASTAACPPSYQRQRAWPGPPI